MRAFLGAFAILIGLALGLFPIMGAQAEDAPLRVALVDSPQGFDPALAVVGASHQAIDLIFSGLTRLDNNSDPQPDLAESWTTDETGTVYTFKLRSGVKFHDGQPLTAERPKDDRSSSAVVEPPAGAARP